MKVETLIVGPLQTNCYLVSRDEGDEVIVIDPAGDGEKIISAIGKRKIAAVLLTHGHFDHTGALKYFTDYPIYIHPADEIMLTDPAWSVGAKFGDLEARPAATDFIQEGSKIHLAGLDISVMHLPGHTLGGVAYEIEDVLFTGDTLFCHAYGRVDHPGGDLSVLMGSLKRLLKLEKNYYVLPGHGRPTTIFQERGYA
ncbi:MAG: MBL fold metallo-hydrolase [Clostridiales bacterium]|nr:MBL fold metallo-hydrolase [Clostridiales bacterium]